MLESLESPVRNMSEALAQDTAPKDSLLSVLAQADTLDTWGSLDIQDTQDTSLMLRLPVDTKKPMLALRELERQVIDLRPIERPRREAFPAAQPAPNHQRSLRRSHEQTIARRRRQSSVKHSRDFRWRSAHKSCEPPSGGQRVSLFIAVGRK